MYSSYIFRVPCPNWMALRRGLATTSCPSSSKRSALPYLSKISSSSQPYRSPLCVFESSLSREATVSSPTLMFLKSACASIVRPGGVRPGRTNGDSRPRSPPAHKGTSFESGASGGSSLSCQSRREEVSAYCISYPRQLDSRQSVSS